MAAPDPKNPSHRTKAHQLRKAQRNGQTLHETDALWLADYEEKQARGRAAAAGAPTERGRSKSARTVEFRMQEAAEAAGEGPTAGPTAAAAAVGAALAAKEEGRRLDALTMHSIDALKEACAVYKDICLTLRERAEVLEQTHIEMLMSVRAHFIAATEAESALVQKEAEARPEDQLLTMLMAKYLGVPPGALPRPRPRPPGPKPPANGAPKP